MNIQKKINIKDENFESSLQLALDDFGLLSSGFRLKNSQRNLLTHFLNGVDSIGVLPTNYRKSVIYQLSPTVAKYLHGVGYDNFPKNPAIIVISPINALVDDQVKRCKELNLKGIKLCTENIEDIKDGDFDVLFSSPESILSECYRQVLLLCEKFRKKIIGIVIDEAHVVVKWGTSSDPEKAAFRSMYSQVGKLRAFFDLPFLCLTATANKHTRQHLIKILQLKNPKIEKLSPEKNNVKLSVNKVKSVDEFIDYLEKGLLAKIKESGKCEKSIIYCSFLSKCGEIYIALKNILKNYNFPIAMFHSKTPDEIKNDVLSDFIKENSDKYCIAVATCALGLGVNIPNIRTIIHFGLPSDIESYIQEIGRAGRDNEFSDAELFFLPQHIMHCTDEDLIKFIKNGDKLCRRKLLLTFFKEIGNPLKNPHRCCDICDKNCQCSSCTQTIPIDTSEGKQKQREVTEEQAKVFKECLESRNEKFPHNAAVFNVNSILTISSVTIKQLLESLDILFSMDQLVKEFSLSEPIAVDVLDIINQIFSDISPVAVNVSDGAYDFSSDNNSLIFNLDNIELLDDIDEDIEDFVWQDHLDAL